MCHCQTMMLLNVAAKWPSCETSQGPQDKAARITNDLQEARGKAVLLPTSQAQNNSSSFRNVSFVTSYILARHQQLH